MPQTNGYVSTPCEVMMDPTLPTQHKVVYSILLGHCIKDDTCYPSVDYLSFHGKMDKKTVRRVIKELEGRGLLAVTVRPGQSNLYQLGTPSRPLPNEPLPNEPPPNEPLPNEPLPNEPLPNEPLPKKGQEHDKLPIQNDITEHEGKADQTSSHPYQITPPKYKSTNKKEKKEEKSAKSKQPKTKKTAPKATEPWILTKQSRTESEVEAAIDSLQQILPEYQRKYKALDMSKVFREFKDYWLYGANENGKPNWKRRTHWRRTLTTWCDKQVEWTNKSKQLTSEEYAEAAKPRGRVF